jgi:bifunctional non-homologous end joining protein LigD
MFKTKFSIQNHYQKKKRSSHFDLRILNKAKSALWSWALPKSEFPEKSKKVLAIKTPNHKVSYMYFHGLLPNGDKITIFDRGECKVLVNKHNLVIIFFRGKHIKGAYNFIRMMRSKNSWLVTKSKKYEK